MEYLSEYLSAVQIANLYRCVQARGFPFWVNIDAGTYPGMLAKDCGLGALLVLKYDTLHTRLITVRCTGPVDVKTSSAPWAFKERD